MRTKTLICAAALAAGVATSMAQSSNVYSLNVVGYVNYTIPGDFKQILIANPLNNANNNITNLFSAPTLGAAQDGAQIERWNAVGAVNDVAADIYSWDGVAKVWRKNGGLDISGFVLKPGEAVFFLAQYSGGQFTNTYVGDVIQGPYTNTVLGGFSQNALGSSAPQGGSFTNTISQLVPGDGDQVYRWDPVAVDIDSSNNGNANWSQGLGKWLDGSQSAQTALPNIAIGEGLFYINQNSTKVWVRNFTVQ